MGSVILCLLTFFLVLSVFFWKKSNEPFGFENKSNLTQVFELQIYQICKKNSCVKLDVFSRRNG